MAALLQEDTSAIVTLECSEFSRPAKLDGTVYASYGARSASALFFACCSLFQELEAPFFKGQSKVLVLQV